MVPEICLNYENQNYWSISQTWLFKSANVLVLLTTADCIASSFNDLLQSTVYVFWQILRNILSAISPNFSGFLKYYRHLSFENWRDYFFFCISASSLRRASKSSFSAKFARFDDFFPGCAPKVRCVIGKSPQKMC